MDFSFEALAVACVDFTSHEIDSNEVIHLILLEAEAGNMGPFVAEVISCSCK